MPDTLSRSTTTKIVIRASLLAAANENVVLDAIVLRGTDRKRYGSQHRRDDDVAEDGDAAGVVVDHDYIRAAGGCAYVHEGELETEESHQEHDDERHEE